VVDRPLPLDGASATASAGLMTWVESVKVVLPGPAAAHPRRVGPGYDQGREMVASPQGWRRVETDAPSGGGRGPPRASSETASRWRTTGGRGRRSTTCDRYDFPQVSTQQRCDQGSTISCPDRDLAAAGVRLTR
jgi:hypothetical protein